MHVHVVSGEGEAKFWIAPVVELARNHRYGSHQLKEIEVIIQEHHDELVAAWEQYFGG